MVTGYSTALDTPKGSSAPIIMRDPSRMSVDVPAQVFDPFGHRGRWRSRMRFVARKPRRSPTDKIQLPKPQAGTLPRPASVRITSLKDPSGDGVVHHPPAHVV